jgi:DNA primase
MLSSPIEEIKNRLDIVDVIGSYIKLHKAGVNYRAVCPFHNEKKPSFFVNPARQIWHCFGSCSTGGDIFKFVMMIEGVEFGDALRILAQRAGVELKRESVSQRTERQKLYEITELACRFFEKQLQASSAGLEAKKYLLDRGVKEETITKWRLGYAPDVWDGLTKFLIGKGHKSEDIERAGLCIKSPKSQNYFDRFKARIIFPVFNLSSQPIGFGGRTLKKEETAKYINSPATLLYDKSRILYGLNRAGIEIRKKNQCILVEGYMDVIMSSQQGFENIVATSGTALTPFQLRILKRYSDNLYTAFDMDLAGDSATKRGIDLAQTEGFNIKIITMPEGKDPADVAKEGRFGEFIDKAKTIHDFYFENTLLKFDKSTIDGKRSISKVLLPVVKRISNKIEQNVWVKDLAQALSVREEDVLEELSKVNLSREDSLPKTEEDSPASKKLKTRKELLEERLLYLSIKLPESLKIIKEDDMNLFSPQTISIIDHLKNKTKLEGDLEDRVSFLFLKADMEEMETDFGKEFKSCFREIKSLTIKDKLAEICQDIRIAEQAKDSEKVQELVEKFCQYSKSRNELESQTS